MRSLRNYVFILSHLTACQLTYGLLYRLGWQQCFFGRRFTRAVPNPPRIISFSVSAVDPGRRVSSRLAAADAPVGVAARLRRGIVFWADRTF